ncbi:MAG: hypothetical protein ACUVTR_05665 [Dehalococcoidia bacterium]
MLPSAESLQARLSCHCGPRPVPVCQPYRRQIGPGIIHHSDQGIQHASGEYVDDLKRQGFLVSMAGTGNLYEKTAKESFVKTLKHEKVNLCGYETYQDVVTRFRCFFEEISNHKDFT